MAGNGSGGYMTPRNPLNAKLDAKSFVQLTVWVLVILAAWALGNYVFGKAKKTAGELSGKVSATGSVNPFFS